MTHKYQKKQQKELQKVNDHSANVCRNCNHFATDSTGWLVITLHTGSTMKQGEINFIDPRGKKHPDETQTHSLWLGGWGGVPHTLGHWGGYM